MSASKVSSVSGIRSLLDGERRAISCWLSSPDPFTQEAFIAADFDLVSLDMQHGLVDRSDCRDAIARAVRSGKAAIARVPVGDNAMASWMLDMGASGVIMPMIENAEDARTFVKHAKYPPLGLRSYGPTRAVELRSDGDASRYFGTANEENLAFAMIETRTALASIDEIAAIEGLDGLFVGPADLSIALSDDSKVDPEGARAIDAMRQVVEACGRNGKIPACYAHTPEYAHACADLGFRLICVGLDTRAIADGADRLARAMRR